MGAGGEHVVEKPNDPWHWVPYLIINAVITLNFLRSRAYPLTVGFIHACPLHDQLAHVETRLSPDTLQHAGDAIIVEWVFNEHVISYVLSVLSSLSISENRTICTVILLSSTPPRSRGKFRMKVWRGT
jgi:hypothetical protein